MKILLYGISCVGKTTTAEILAEKLDYKFYDLDEEVKTRLNVTISQFIKSNIRSERDRIRGKIISSILDKDENMVFAITPMYYTRYFKSKIYTPDVLNIELRDTPENIFSRIIFTDENDVPYKDDEYVQKHRKEYLSEIKKDITFYKNVYKKLERVYVFDMNGDPPDKVVERIINRYSLTGTEDAQ